MLKSFVKQSSVVEEADSAKELYAFRQDRQCYWSLHRYNDLAALAHPTSTRMDFDEAA